MASARIPRYALAAATVCALCTGLVATPAPASAQDTACENTVSGGFLGIGEGSGFYDDPKASDRYDDTFSGSFDVPERELRTRVPQGMATWTDWRGNADLLLVTAYLPSEDPHRESNVAPSNPDERSHVIALDASTGQHVGTVEVPSFHAGGIAVFEKQGWAFLPNTDRAGGEVSRYSLEALGKAITDSTPGKPARLEPTGTDQRVHGTSFLTSHGPTNTLWAGRFSRSGPEFMQPYIVGGDGDLTEPEDPRDRKKVQVPPRTQGVVVTDDLFVYSSSFGRGNESEIHVVRRGAGSSRLDTATTRCFRAPSMAEGMAVYAGAVHLAFESGASFYLIGDDNPRNVIKNLHRARLDDLDDLVR